MFGAFGIASAGIRLFAMHIGAAPPQINHNKKERAMTKITLSQAPWDDSEERVWKYLLTDKLATAEQVAINCDVPLEFAQKLIAKIGTPREVFVKEVPFKTTRVVHEAAGSYVEYTDTALAMQVGGSHYKDMEVQPWQAMEAWLTPEEYRGYHKGVAIAYLAREQQKGGLDDIKKAIHHLQRLVEVTDGPTPKAD